MKKGTKLALLIGAAAAVVSAVVLVIVFWDKLLSKCPCKKAQFEEELEDAESVEEPEEIVVYTEEETADFADLGEPEAEAAEEEPTEEETAGE